MKIFLEKYTLFFPIAIMLALFSGIGAIIWFGILPYQERINEKADAIQEFEVSRENRDRQIAKLPELESQLETIVADENTLDILLSEKNIVDFVKTLEQLAIDTHTHVTISAKDKEAIQEKKKNVSTGKNSATSNKDTSSNDKKETFSLLGSLPYDRYLHVTITVLGEYHDIFTFLHKMETLPIGLDVIGMSIGESGVENIAQKVSVPPANNPFAMFADGLSSPATPLVEEAKPTDITGPLQASFDTVIYLRKQE